MSSEHPFFDIICPVHNVSLYLEACIESILSQSFGSFELILVDDGSTDSSASICEQYARRDSRVRFLKQEWKGVSAARNFGLENIEGEYILFIDADDEMAPGALSAYKRAIDTYKPCIVKAGYRIERTSGSEEIAVKEDIVISEPREMLSLTEKTRYYGYVWNSAFKKSVVEPLRFSENLNWLEDQIFSYECFKKCRSMALIMDVVYVYNIRDVKSLSTSLNPKTIIDASTAEEETKMAILGNGPEDELYQHVLALYNERIYSLLRSLYNSGTDRSQRGQICAYLTKKAVGLEKGDACFMISSPLPFWLKDMFLGIKFKIKTLLGN